MLDSAELVGPARMLSPESSNSEIDRLQNVIGGEAGSQICRSVDL